MTAQTKKEYEPIEDGDYLMAIKSVEDAMSSKGDPMVKVAYEVQEGDHKSRLLFDFFMVEHSNPDVPEFAKQRVGRLLNALGVIDGFSGIGSDYGNLQDFVGQPFIAQVDYSKPYKNKEGKMTVGNRIKSFKSR